MAKKPLDVWIAEALSDPDKERCTAISLVHMQGTVPQEIHTVKIGGGSNEYNPKNMANMFHGKANAYCQDIHGVQMCALHAFYGTNEPQARQPFMVNVQADFASGLATEAPDERGRTQMKMRWDETVLQQTYRKQQHLDETLMDFNRMLMADNVTMRRDVMDSVKIVSEMMLTKATDEHNRRMEALAFERATEERKKWLSFAPPLINRLLGTQVFPESFEDTALIEHVAENLTEDHLNMINTLLPKELHGPLSMRLMAAREKKAKAEAERTALAPYRGSPEDDVTGGTH